MSVSITGSPRARMGTRIATVAAPFIEARRLITASRNPSVREPESPMYTLAGAQLCRKNPRHAPTIANISRTVRAFPWIQAKMSKLAAMIAATPPARPSRPSRRLMALVTPTVHTTVTKPPQSPRSTSPQRGMYRFPNDHPPYTIPAAART